MIRLFNEEGRKLKAVGYVRVSTEDQAREGYSVAAQEEAIRSYCKAKGWTLLRVYRDEGLSAYKDVRRPGYEALMASMSEWDVVVVWKLNRLHRTMRGFVRDGIKLAEAKKDLASITESLDTSSAMGKLVYHLLGALSEFESDQTSERVKASFAQKFKDDEDAWYTRPPLGYDLVNGSLVVNEAEAVIVRHVFGHVREGTPTKSLADAMNRAKMHGKSGGTWSQVSVLQVVHNPVYAGYVYYAGVLRKNGHAPLVTVETFNEAQVALYIRTSKHHRYPLLLGAERIEAQRKTTSGKGAAVYVPKRRPAGLDEAVAKARRKEAGA